MKKTIFIAGRLRQEKELSTALRSHHLYVVVLEDATQLEKQVNELLFPDLTILSVTGNPAADTPLITLTEMYPEEKKGNLVFIFDSRLKHVRDRLFYRSYSKVYFEQRIDVEEVVKKVLEMPGLNGPH